MFSYLAVLLKYKHKHVSEKQISGNLQLFNQKVFLESTEMVTEKGNQEIKQIAVRWGWRRK